jgi:zinc transport system substrate-binding protein
MLRLIILILFTPILIVMNPGQGFAEEAIPVFVSILPQKYFVQQIGKERVAVQVMVAPGASPHTYEPKPRQMGDLSRAKLYFAIGVPFENVWLAKIAATNRQMRVVHTDHGIEKLAMAVHRHGAETHGHDQEGGSHGEHHQGQAGSETDHHEQAGRDPHIWLSPPLVKIQARTVLTALQEIDPAHSLFYEANFDAFATQIDRLDADLKAILADRTGLQFMVFHPSWGYFAQTYGLRQIPIEIEGKAPKPAQLTAVIQRARQRGIRVVFAQPQFATKSAQIVAREIGGQVVLADPLAEDWLANLRSVADKFRMALR